MKRSMMIAAAVLCVAAFGVKVVQTLSASDTSVHNWTATVYLEPEARGSTAGYKYETRLNGDVLGGASQVEADLINEMTGELLGYVRGDRYEHGLGRGITRMGGWAPEGETSPGDHIRSEGLVSGPALGVRGNPPWRVLFSQSVELTAHAGIGPTLPPQLDTIWHADALPVRPDIGSQIAVEWWTRNPVEQVRVYAIKRSGSQPADWTLLLTLPCDAGGEISGVARLTIDEAAQQALQDRDALAWEWWLPDEGPMHVATVTVKE